MTENFRINLWFDNQAEDAVNFYTSLFSNASKGAICRYSTIGQEFHQQPEGSVMTVNFTLEDLDLVALNGGPVFEFNPSISLFVQMGSEEDVNALWDSLIEDGKVMMPLDKYDWSDRYGWLNDKYGVSWQIMLEPNRTETSICPLVFFSGDMKGKAGDAIHFYNAVFKKSELIGIAKYPAEAGELEGLVMHAMFRLNDQMFMIMDSATEDDFPFNEAVSIIVECDTQDEIDYYWDTLLEGGEEQQCGWLKDRFGVSWQIVPKGMEEMLKDIKSEKAEKALKAMFGMKKIIISDLY